MRGMMLWSLVCRPFGHCFMHASAYFISSPLALMSSIEISVSVYLSTHISQEPYGHMFFACCLWLTALHYYVMYFQVWFHIMCLMMLCILYSKSTDKQWKLLQWFLPNFACTNKTSKYTHYWLVACRVEVWYPHYFLVLNLNPNI